MELKFVASPAPCRSVKTRRRIEKTDSRDKFVNNLNDKSTITLQNYKYGGALTLSMFSYIPIISVKLCLYFQSLLVFIFSCSLLKFNLAQAFLIARSESFSYHIKSSRLLMQGLRA